MSLKSYVKKKVATAVSRVTYRLLTKDVKNHRPRPWSMQAPYVTWPGLFDKAWIGRHQGDLEPGEASLPPEEELVNLFRRPKMLGPEGAEVMEKCPKNTTMLFMFMAQWFTDSFLRTYPEYMNRTGRTDSNHEVDLVQLYGLDESKTRMLRERVNGKLTHRMAVRQANGEDWPPLLCRRNSEGQAELAPPFDGVGQSVGGLYRRDPYGPASDQEDAQPLHDLFKIRTGLARTMGLAFSDPKVDDRLLTFHATGLDNGNGTLGYTAINALMLRAHNAVADDLWNTYSGKPGWDQERVFQTTRCILIVLLLRIVMHDYIGHVADMTNIILLEKYAEKKAWNRSNRISIEFNLLYRWHSMIPETIRVSMNRLGPDAYRNSPGALESMGLRAVLEALSSRDQTVGRISLFNTPGFLFRKSPGGQSAVEATIALTRKAKLKPLNAYRKQFGLKPLKSIKDLVGDQPNANKIIAELQRLYGDDIDNVELFPGLFAEAHDGNVIMGKTMKAMVTYDAFTQLLTNPLLAEGIYEESTFTPEGMALIDNIDRLQGVVDKVFGAGAPQVAFGYREK